MIHPVLGEPPHGNNHLVHVGYQMKKFPDGTTRQVPLNESVTRSATMRRYLDLLD